MTEFEHKTPSSLSLAGKWQIPLLLLSIIACGVAGWLYHAGRNRPTWDERYDALVRQTDAVTDGNYSEADAAAQQLLADTPPEAPAQRGRVLLHRAEVRWRAIRHTNDRGDAQLRDLIALYTAAEDAGATLSAEARERLAGAYADLGEVEQAVVQLRAEAETDAARAPDARRRILELRQASGGTDCDGMLSLLDEYLATAGLDMEHYGWALERKVDLLIDEGRLGEALAVIRRELPTAAGEACRPQLQYQQCRILAMQHREQQADDQLTTLEDEVEPTSELAGRISLLRGDLNRRDNPAEAEKLFRGVLDRFPRSSLATAARIGLGRACAQMRVYDVSLENYEQAVEELVAEPGNPHVGLRDLRESLEGTWRVLNEAGEPMQALRYAQAEWKVFQLEDPAPPAAERLELLERLGHTHRDVADRLEARRAELLASPVDPAELDELARQRREQLASAGEVFLRLSKAAVGEDDRLHGEGLWQAGDSFDQAAMPQRAIEAFRAFADGRTSDPRLPEVLFRLGQAYQAIGEHDSAIEAYRRNLERDPRAENHPKATEGMIPMAMCFIAKGPEHYDDAERILRRITDDNPAITPQSDLYRQALFALGELHYRQGKWREAIARLGQAIHRYPGEAIPFGQPDPGGLRAQYLQATRSAYRMAECYRRGAQEAAAEAAEQENLLVREELHRSHDEQLAQAERTFGQVIDRLEALGEGLDELERTYRLNAYYSRGDCLFDLGRYADAIDRYETAVRTFPLDPSAIGGLVQIYNCHYAMGQMEEARAAMARARVLLQQMDPEHLRQYEQMLGGAAPGGDAGTWRQWLDTVSRLDPSTTGEGRP